MFSNPTFPFNTSTPRNTAMGLPVRPSTFCSTLSVHSASVYKKQKTANYKHPDTHKGCPDTPFQLQMKNTCLKCVPKKNYFVFGMTFYQLASVRKSSLKTASININPAYRSGRIKRKGQKKENNVNFR
jgi:hypothetical protein